MQDIYKKIALSNKPRVHIQYEVETEGERKQVELPFVVGVMGDFVGDTTDSLPPLKAREFLAVNSNNIDATMKQLSPSVNLAISSILSPENKKTPISLRFNSLSDFEPDGIIKQVPELQELLSIRHALADLLNKSELSEPLTELLESVTSSKQSMRDLANTLNNLEKK